jgi:hypothetical protein
MPYEIGDTEPPHIDVHNELNAEVAELSTRSGIPVVLPPIVSLGDDGHVSDHNLYTTAIQKIADGLSPGPAIVASHTGGNVTSNVTISGKTYDIYTFTEAMTPASLRLTDEARERLTDKDVITAVESGASLDELLEKYGDVLRDAVEIIPASDPGLSMTFQQPGFVDIIAVGGGGGAFPASGGAGAGALLQVMQAYAPGVCNITVGAGASGGAFSAGGNGYASSFGQYYAPGGGGPFDRLSIQSQGGSGAGGNAGGVPGTSGIPTLGNDGGAGGGTTGSGGGGGATQPGQDASGDAGGNGGDGQDISSFLGWQTGQAVVGGGGGGAGGGQGGAGGGGNSSRPGADNTGGGAGGGNALTPGGSGLVIVRVQVA